MILELDNMRYFLHLSYDGTLFHGWQFQPGQDTVQGTLKNALEILLKTPINIIGCGRTDTGVHAKQFYAHFDFDGIFPELFLLKLNSILPISISVYDVFEMHAQAQSRFDATERTYQYFIHTRKESFLRHYSCEFRYHSLDFAAIEEATALLVNYTDFTPVIKIDPENPVTTCKLKEAYWERTSEHTLVFTITSNRFLYNMIRRIVGCMIQIGRGQLSVAEFKHIMDTKGEFKVIKLAPSNGLHLTRVVYPYEMKKIF